MKNVQWAGLLVAMAVGHAAPGADLAAEFARPPDSARPGVYWYFMDGNQTREGMAADLKAMHKAGLRKALFLEVNIGVPRGPVAFMSEEWQDNFAHAVRLADELGMEIILGTGPGWAGAGGPWIDPSRSMQHLRSSRVDVTGPGKFTGRIPVPEPRRPSKFAGLSPALAKAQQEWYEDVAVLAFRTPAPSAAIDLFDVKVLNETQPYTIWKHVPRFVPSGADYPEPQADAVIDPGGVIDLTPRLKPDGSLDWDIPAGNWSVLRFAARSNGCTTRPAPTPGHGFEVDRFSAEAFAYHFQQFQRKLLEKIGPRRPGRGLTCLHLDSWESGSQNWSSAFRAEFKKRRGYDPRPFFPAYAGMIVGSREKTERFLWDLRRTAQELVIENHAGAIRKQAHQNGLYYSCEPYDMNPAGDLDLGAVADVPMCEFWADAVDSVYSVVEGASIAHTMGRPVLRAESFTSTGNYYQNPADLKNQTDWAFAMGINDLIFHTHQHQPLGLDGPKPGMAMGTYGLNWHRNQTFWPMVAPYHDYIARCGYLLRQGASVADILYLTPEGAPHIFMPPEDAMFGPGIQREKTSYGEWPAKRFSPMGILREKMNHGFDAVSPGILMARAKVENGRIVFPGGSSYRLLIMPRQDTMTPELLEHLESLVRRGATVMGAPPRKSPSLADYPRCDRRVRALAEKMWGGGTAPGQPTERPYGRGRILWGGETTTNLYPSYAATAAWLEGQGIAPVFTATGPIRHHLRRTGTHDIFFVANREAQPQVATGVFRTDGAAPELWHPVTGARRALPQWSAKGETVSVPLNFAGYEGYFVVFDRAAGRETPPAAGENFPEEKTLVTIGGPYRVAFDPAWGGPAEPVVIERLEPWNLRAEEGVRYYSGAATYRVAFDAPPAASLPPAARLHLDLGTVHKLARVKLNGEDLGIVWTPPFRVDVTGRLRPAGNELEVTVVNTWANRLIGDQQPANKDVRSMRWDNGLLEGKTFGAGRYTFTTHAAVNAGSPLQESGLLGPVTVRAIETGPRPAPASP